MTNNHGEDDYMMTMMKDISQGNDITLGYDGTYWVPITIHQLLHSKMVISMVVHDW